jgi:hypothetical protein
VEEEQQLRVGFAAGISAAKLAEQHQRSRGAITSRLLHLGLLPRRARQIDSRSG